MSSTLLPTTSGMTPTEVSWTLMPLVTTPLPRSMVWYHPNASACACSSDGEVMGRERSEAVGGHCAPISVRRVTRPGPPQVIPRPAAWRPGEPAPWATLGLGQRTGIGIDRVLDALVTAGLRGSPPRTWTRTVSSGRSRHRSWRTSPGRPSSTTSNAAVLAVMFEETDEGEARLVLTRRSSGLRTHRGEVSFPGGRLEKGEAPADAARREAHEEVGLDPTLVTTVGWMHPVMTMVSSSLILPILATVAQRPRLVASPPRSSVSSTSP